MLTRSPSFSDRETEKILSIALKYQLMTVAEDVCASRAAYWKQRGRTAQSLQWLSRCPNKTKLLDAVRSLLKQGPRATDYTTLDTLLQSLSGGDKDDDDDDNARKVMNDGAIQFLSRYHETCVVMKNAEELRVALESEDATSELDERGLEQARGNLHYLKSEAAKRLCNLLCDISLNQHPSFWLPLLEQLEPYVYCRPPVVTASHSRRVLRRIEEISTSWRKDDFLPPVLPPWEEVQVAITNIFRTWELRDDKNNGREEEANHTFEIKGDQYISLRGSIPILPSPELLGNIDWVDNIESVITEETLKLAYNMSKKRATDYKNKTEGDDGDDSGLVPRMRWALAENISMSLGAAHQQQRANGAAATQAAAATGGMSSRPSKHQRR